MNRAVIYARVSSTGDRQSTERQVADLTRYAAACGMEVVKVYEEKDSGAKRSNSKSTTESEIRVNPFCVFLYASKLFAIKKWFGILMGIG